MLEPRKKGTRQPEVSQSVSPIAIAIAGAPILKPTPTSVSDTYS